MELTARLNGPPELTGRALIVLCAYRGGARRKAPWRIERRYIGRIVNALTLLQLRQFIAMHRDHAANPRDFAYQIALAEGVVERARFASFDLLLDAAFGKAAGDAPLAGAAMIGVGEVGRRSFGRDGQYDTIVLIYPDALGLSWSRAEAQALQAARRVVVATGRRRLFTLDRQVRRALLWRRFLATSRLAEMVMALSVVPLAAGLAAADRIRGRA